MSGGESPVVTRAFCAPQFLSYLYRMSRRHSPWLRAVAVVASLTGVVVNAPIAAAQSAKPEAGKSDEGKAKRVRPNNAERSNDLDFLFSALKAAPDAVAAKAVEGRIQQLWLNSGSDTANLLMSRVQRAMGAKDVELSLQLLDSIVELKPEYVEGWNRRATLHFMQKDYGASIADLRQVLAREPRHFGALVGLGMILQEVDEDKMALVVLRRALDLHPHLPRVGDMIKTLTEKVEGRET